MPEESTWRPIGQSDSGAAAVSNVKKQNRNLEELQAKK
jgi:hypothetical protein